MPYSEIHVPTSPRLLLARLWPSRFGVPTQGNSPDIITNPKISESRVNSYNSNISTDSYLAGLDPNDPIDVKFRQLCQDILVLDTGRDILQERKMLSHQAKKGNPIVMFTRKRGRRHRKSDDAGVVEWTPIMGEEHKIYKAKVAAIKDARRQAKTARLVAEDSTRRGEDVALREMKLCHAMDYQQVWFDTAIEAAKARIEFMHKYNPLPCFTPRSERGHVHAATSNLNSARNAFKALEAQREELRKLQVEAKRNFEQRRSKR